MVDTLLYIYILHYLERLLQLSSSISSVSASSIVVNNGKETRISNIGIIATHSENIYNKK